MSNENFDEIFAVMTEGLDKLPESVASRVKEQFSELKEILVDARKPRILIIGRRGAGKSSLINAILREKRAAVGSVVSETGEAKWHDFATEKGALSVLDTRGMGDHTKPESSHTKDFMDDLKTGIAAKVPDAILFLCKAKEVDAHIEEDLKQVARVKEYIFKEHGYDAPMVALVTQVDELDPKRVLPPYDNETKKKNINDAVKVLDKALKDSGANAGKVMAISTYAEFDEQSHKLTHEEFWQVEELLEYLIAELPKSAQVQMARLSALRRVQSKVAQTVVNVTSALCGTIAAIPIPVADIFPITAAQVAMIVAVGYISGRKLSKESATEFVAALGVNAGAGFVLRQIARQLVKLIPVAGDFISAGVAAAGTKVLGAAAISYFIDRKSMAEVKSNVEKGMAEAAKA